MRAKALPVSNGATFLEVVSCGRTSQATRSWRRTSRAGSFDRAVGELCFRGRRQRRY